MKKNQIITVVFLSGIFIILIMTASYLDIGTNNDWVGFLGGLIGSFVGVLGVYWTMREDQKKREEERKKDYFINNISIYLEIIHFLNYKTLNKLQKELNSLKRVKEWYQIDRETKASIEKIISICRKGDEVEGPRDAARDYILDRCGEKLTVKTWYNIKGEEPIEVDEVLFVAVEELLSIISRVLEDLVDYGGLPVEILVTKEDFKKSILSTKHLSGFVRYSDEFYYIILDFPDSNNWNKYLTDRTNALLEIKEFREALILKVESLQ